MSVNISSSVSESCPPANPSPVKLPLNVHCFFNKPNTFVFGTFNIANIFLLLPVNTFILYLGLKQRQRCRPSAARISHSDVLTQHVVVMELISAIGCFLNFCAICTHEPEVLRAGIYIFTFTFFGELIFHALTCVDRYLAVVHPIVYLRLKKERGIRIRNVCVCCAWLLSLLITSVLSEDNLFMAMDFLLVATALIIVSFCSLSVLCVLIRPGPGEQGGGRKKVDPAKQRAFYTILAILGILLMRFVWDLIWAVLFTSGDVVTCALITCNLWFKLPSSLLLPLIFLQKAGKLVCCQKAGAAGRGRD